MPLFTKFKKAKEAAIEHKKAASVQQVTTTKTPYKHVPTHAAQDALAASPTTLRPEELQARIAAARRRRASSYDPSLIARRAVYHSCESSQNTSRANSAAASSCASTNSSFKGKGRGDDFTNSIVTRPQTLLHRHSMPAESKVPEEKDYTSPLPGGLAYPPTLTQRPRPYRSASRRSSFAKRKSPLSNVSVDEDSDQVWPTGSTSSAVSSQSINSVSLAETSRQPHATLTPSVASRPQMMSRTNSTTIDRSQASSDAPRPKSMWTFFPRKSVGVVAH